MLNLRKNQRRHNDVKIITNETRSRCKTHHISQVQFTIYMICTLFKTFKTKKCYDNFFGYARTQSHTRLDNYNLPSYRWASWFRLRLWSRVVSLTLPEGAEIRSLSSSITQTSGTVCRISFALFKEMAYWERSSST